MGYLGHLYVFFGRILEAGSKKLDAGKNACRGFS